MISLLDALFSRLNTVSYAFVTGNVTGAAPTLVF